MRIKAVPSCLRWFICYLTWCRLCCGQSGSGYILILKLFNHTYMEMTDKDELLYTFTVSVISQLMKSRCRESSICVTVVVLYCNAEALCWVWVTNHKSYLLCHTCETHNQDSNICSYYCFCFELSLVSLGFQNLLQCFTLVFISFSLSYFNVFGFIHLWLRKFKIGNTK